MRRCSCRMSRCVTWPTLFSSRTRRRSGVVKSMRSSKRIQPWWWAWIFCFGSVTATRQRRMRSEEEMPSPSAIYVANRRLKEWAVQHPQVTVVSLSSFMHSLMANEPLTLRGQTLSEIKTRKLLQSDKLHPTAQGSTLLALVVLDAFQSHQPNVPAEDIRWDSEQVYQMGFNATPTPAKNPAKPATEPAASAPAGK